MDKKKGSKGKVAGAKQPDTAASTAVAATPNSWDEDGWEDASQLLEPARPAPPGLHCKSDAKPSLNDENRQPGLQESATPSGRSGSEPQCSKCGKWGHIDKHCSEQYCEICQKHGHSTVKCKDKPLKALGKAADEQERSHKARPAEPQRAQRGPANLESTRCHHCDQYGHLAVTCPEAGDRQLLCNNCKQRGHIAALCPKMQCYNCQGYGHRAMDCRNHPASRPPKTAPLVVSRRHGSDAQSDPKQPGAAAEQLEEQQRGRQKGRGRNQQADASASSTTTLPISRSGR